MSVILVLCARPHVPIRRVDGADELRRFWRGLGLADSGTLKGVRRWAGLGCSNLPLSLGPSRVSASESS